MESTVVQIARLLESRNWGYIAHSENALQTEQKLKASPYKLAVLGEHITGLAGGLTPRGAQYPDSGVIFIRVGNIQPYGLDISNVKYIDEELHRGELQRCQLQENDVLLAITGATFGKACTVPPDLGAANINQHIVRIRTRPELNPHYLAFFFNSDIGTKQSIAMSTGGTRPALDYDAIRSMLIPLPPLELQESIAETLRKSYVSRDELLRKATHVVAEAKVKAENMLLGRSIHA